jgi:Arc/MetJ-type ribon-helix-helix transcriptional regulator
VSIELTPDNEHFLASEIASGTFADRADALNSAVSLLKERKALLARLDEGRRQLDTGDYLDCESSRSAEYVEEIHRRGLQRRDSHKTRS